MITLNWSNWGYGKPSGLNGTKVHLVDIWPSSPDNWYGQWNDGDGGEFPATCYITVAEDVTVNITAPTVNTPCCQILHISNKWDSGSDYQIGGTFEGKPFWVNNAKNYAMWYDGDSGSDFDWVFGKVEDMQNGGGEMFSDKESTCPTDITEWTNDSTAKVSCSSEPLAPNVTNCDTLQVENEYYTGLMRNAGEENGRPYWADPSDTYVIWFDGDSGSDADWVFGKKTDMFNTGYLYSNTDAPNPLQIRNWYTSTSSSATTTKPNAITCSALQSGF